MSGGRQRIDFGYLAFWFLVGSLLGQGILGWQANRASRRCAALDALAVDTPNDGIVCITNATVVAE